MRPDHRKAMGDRCEAIAAEHLTRLGYRICERQYRCRLGEVDLICLDRETLVFVEVKARRNERFGHASEAIGWQKQARLQRIAEHYMAREPGRACRFDVVLVAWRGAGASIEHWPNAFP